MIKHKECGSVEIFKRLCKDSFSVYKEDKFFYLYEANTEYKFCINELIEKGLIVEIKRINNIIEYFKK